VILDEFCAVTGYHRKYAIEVLRGRQLRPVRGRRRPRRYDTKVESTLKVLWEASDHICAERLQPLAGGPGETAGTPRRFASEP